MKNDCCGGYVGVRDKNVGHEELQVGGRNEMFGVSDGLLVQMLGVRNSG